MISMGSKDFHDFQRFFGCSMIFAFFHEFLICSYILCDPAFFKTLADLVIPLKGGRYMCLFQIGYLDSPSLASLVAHCLGHWAAVFAGFAEKCAHYLERQLMSMSQEPRGINRVSRFFSKNVEFLLVRKALKQDPCKHFRSAFVLWAYQQIDTFRNI